MASTRTAVRSLLPRLKQLGVPVRGDEFSLRDLLARIDEAEARGLMSPYATQVLRQWVNTKYVAFQTEDLPWAGAGEARDFSPSYPVDTEAEYQTRTKAARQYHKSRPDVFRALGLKREAHVQISGGRERLRYEGPVPEPKAATRARLREEAPPFRTRTQSPATRAALKKRQDKFSREEIQQQIAAVIQRIQEEKMRHYRKREETVLAYATKEAERLPMNEREEFIQESLDHFRAASPPDFGFLIPTSPDVLVKLGFPRREAALLVERVGGRQIPGTMPRVPSGNAIPLGPSPYEQFQACTGIPLMETEYSVRIDGRLQRTARTASVFALQQKFENATIYLRGLVLRAAGREIGRWTHKDFKEWRETNEWDDVDGLFSLFLDDVQKARNKYRGSKLSWDFYFGLAGSEPSSWAPVEVPIGEHSMYWCAPVGVDYRTMRGVNVSTLPSFLSRLTRRRAKKT